MMDTIGARLLANASAFPDSPAVIEGDHTLSFGQYASAALAVAAAIDERDPGERVALLLPTSRAFVLSFVGTMLSGRVPVPLNFFLAPSELKAILADCGARMLITSHAFDACAKQLGADLVWAEDFIPQALQLKPAAPRHNPVATILYTSGTTGCPKGVVLSHRNILANVDACVEHFEFSREHTILSVLPLFHTFALMINLAVPAAIGAKSVLVGRFEPGAVMETIVRNRVTTMAAVPSMYRALARSIARGADLSSVRIPISGGEALPEELFNLYRDSFGVTILEGYGMTETSPAISANTPAHIRPMTVGKPLPKVEVRVVGEDGQDAAADADGEIWVRGDNVMEGYFNRPDETRQVFADGGFLRTGDVGRLDADGFLRITGRKKEMIISAGENVFPREIELVIARHPAVEEVAVIGVPDHARGEAPKAFVVLKPGAAATADEIREFCRQQIARYKVPSQVELRSQLPHSPTGKILKQRLAAEAAEGGSKA